jgi:fructose-1,6-bisphosphatase-3
MDALTLTYLQALAQQFPTVDAALAEISRLNAQLTLPKGTIHLLSDVHGEHAKLKHVINNGSGTLRPLVEELFQKTLTEAERLDLLNLLYYPRETFLHLSLQWKTPEDRAAFLAQFCDQAFIILRHLAAPHDLQDVDSLFPKAYTPLFREFFFSPQLGRSPAFHAALLQPILEERRELEFVRAVARSVRNLLFSELIIAGDFGDRGPRIDRVIETLMHLPHVSLVWGNHDFSWLGACLGCEALIANVLRMSLRYRRLYQLEEGYGISILPLEKLINDLYADDPATSFASKIEGIRDSTHMARMQKAVTILQFKLEAAIIRRNPQFGLDHRNLLSRIDPRTGTVEIDGVRHPLRDTVFPSIDWSDPEKLHPAEAECLERLKQSFLGSQNLWQQMRFMVRRGAMYLIRDENLIFHACVPVDAQGGYLGLKIDGELQTGRALFDACERVTRRVLQERGQADLDLLWYLWSGPLSPVFGKDKIATFESYLVADPQAQHETKNPYFSLLHDSNFCRKILHEFGVKATPGLIINGHVPVRVEKGESPVKDSGLAVTIDGAFSQAYGDHGYTLVLEAQRTYLALHHHFNSVEQAIQEGADVIPQISEMRCGIHPRTVGDTEQGDALRARIEALRQLMKAYRGQALTEAVVA